jgi:hypothetical protein
VSHGAARTLPLATSDQLLATWSEATP